MRFSPFFILVLSIPFYSIQGEEGTSNLPTKSDKEYQTIKAEIVKFHDAEIAKLVKQLEKDKNDAAKAANLDGALAIDSLIKEVKAGKVFKELATNTVNSNIKILTPDEMIFVGTWKRSDGFDCIFNDDGTGKVGEHIITWIVKKKIMIVSFPKNPEWWMHVTNKDEVFTVTLSSGSTMTLDKQVKE